MKPEHITPLLLQDIKQTRIVKNLPLPYQKILPDNMLFSNRFIKKQTIFLIGNY